MNRLAHRDRGIVLNLVVEPGGKALLELSHFRAHRIGSRERVRTGTLEDADRCCGLAAELAVDRVIARCKLDPSHVTHTSNLAIRARLDHDLTKFVFIRQPSLGADSILKRRRPFRNRLRANNAGGDLDVLFLDRLDNILRSQSAR